MKVQKILNYFSILILLVATAMLVIGIYWSSYPYKPMVVKNQPMPILNKNLISGDALQYTLDYCRYTDVQALISRRYVDTIYFSTPDVTATNPKGCQTRTIGISVPSTLPTGLYTLQITYSYRMNPIRTVVIEAETEPFHVTHSEDLPSTK